MRIVGDSLYCLRSVSLNPKSTAAFPFHPAGNEHEAIHDGVRCSHRAAPLALISDLPIKHCISGEAGEIHKTSACPLQGVQPSHKRFNGRQAWHSSNFPITGLARIGVGKLAQSKPDSHFGGGLSYGDPYKPFGSIGQAISDPVFSLKILLSRIWTP